MDNNKHQIVLADDDADDCMFFQDALDELPVSVSVTIVNDGVELMRYLTLNSDNLPDLLFLDLNMPRKTGFECLTEIKEDEKLKHLPVIIYSTSLDVEVLNVVYERGAFGYIRKPGDYTQLKKVIHEAILVSMQRATAQPAREAFVLQP